MKKIQNSKFKSFYSLLSTLYFLPSIAYCLLSTVSFAADVDALVERIQKKYSEIHDIQGTFSQTSYLKDIERTDRYSGKFFIKKPSRMRWGYAEPRDEDVIIRGDDLWIYKKSEKQVLRSRFSREAYSQVPIALLESMGDLRADFDIRAVKEGTLELVPKGKMGFIKKIHLETTSGDFPIKMFTVFDIYDNRIIIKLDKVEINPGLDESLFIFKIPQDVEVFDLK